jgi:hypothetical protein
LEEFEKINETSDELANSFLTADDKEYIISNCLCKTLNKYDR